MISFRRSWSSRSAPFSAAKSIWKPLPKPAVFQPHQSVESKGRFVRTNEPIGAVEDAFGSPRSLRVNEGPTVWLRVMPATDPGKTWSIDELERTSKSSRSSSS